MLQQGISRKLFSWGTNPRKFLQELKKKWEGENQQRLGPEKAPALATWDLIPLGLTERLVLQVRKLGYFFSILFLIGDIST